MSPGSAEILSQTNGSAELSSTIEEMKSSYESETALCAELETISGSLPNLIDRSLCAFTAIDLRLLLERERRAEADFALLAQSDRTDGRIGTLRVPQFARTLDNSGAERLADLLQEIGDGGPVEDPDALCLQLAALLDDLWDHMAFQERVLQVLEGRANRAAAIRHVD